MRDEEPSHPSRSEASSASGDPAVKPRSFGHFLLLSELGRGAQGLVYLAEDTRLHRKVALKVLTAAAAQAPASRDRFRREAEIASKLDHPSICGVHEVGEAEGVPYIAMQYLRGTTLADLIDKSRSASRAGNGERRGKKSEGESVSLAGEAGEFATEDVVRLLERSARALHVAHEAGLVHRDMKPGNIMITPDGSPVLLDFGLARDLQAAGQTLTESGQIVGTPAYLAPEQIVGQRSRVDRRADVYALGVTLYECLTLRRPFEAETWDQLFHQILNGTPESPRRLNPRIPPDLNTVVEVAMDRDPERRYPTAEAFAEDLRKVRAFRPIQAKAPGPLARLRKWAKVHPAEAVGITAGLVFVLAGAGFLVAQGMARTRAVRGHLLRAEALLGGADYAAALEAVAQARERDPSSAKALELRSRIEGERDRAETEARRQADLATAAEARRESTAKQEEYRKARAAIEGLEQALGKERAALFAAYSGEATRGAFAEKERELERREVEAERLVQEAQEALERAGRLEAPWGGPTPETEAAFATFFLSRWKEAVHSRDAARAEWFRSAVERHDREGRYRDELLGRGTLTVSVDPGDAEIHLFRYESYETIRADEPVPRLVPVPTAGVDRSKPGAWWEGFHPGDLCLVITAVEEGSLAARKGLRSGDLLVRLNGAPCGDGEFVRSVEPGSALAAAGVSPPARILSVNGVPVNRRFDFATAPRAPEGEKDRVEILGTPGAIDCDRREVDGTTPAALVEGGASGDMRLLCLRGGEAIPLEVPAGERAGVRCETTAYPLIAAPENRIRAGVPLTVDPGSYLLLVRRDGYEDQRYPAFVPPNGEAKPTVGLQRTETTPPGFVYVPPSAFVYGGDPEAFQAGPPEEGSVPGFFIARKEVTLREWFEFVNDAGTLAAIEAASERRYLPRGEKELFAKKRSEGEGYEWDRGYPDTPVIGVSWNDVQGYLEWRNRGSREAGERWLYDLPTQREWEKAARGVDGRFFPWGNRFDFSLAVSAYREKHALWDAPGGFEPRDESPFGVLDMGGARQEWTRDAVPPRDPNAPPLYYARGGAWGMSAEGAFRSAGRPEANADNATGYTGFRLVARPRP